MAESRAIEYRRKLDELARQGKSIPAEAERAIAQLLRDLEREIIADIAKTDPASYTASRLNALRAEVERNLQQFERAASSAVGAMQQKAFTEAALSVDAAVAAGTGSVLIHPVIDRHMLSVAQGYSADLISGVSREGATKINTALQRAYMGRASLTDLIAQVDGVLEKTVANRAMNVATNEVLRMHALASQSRIGELATRHEGLGKQWVHTPAARVPRISHLLADKQIRKADEPFDVGGEDLMYPRDPSGSAENTINCHCLMRPYLPPEKLKATDQERSLLKSLGLAVGRGA